MAVAWVVALFGPPSLLLLLEYRRGRRIAVFVLASLAGLIAVFLGVRAGVLGALLVTGLMVGGAYGYGAAAMRLLDAGECLEGWQVVPLKSAIGLAILIVLGIVVGVAGALSAGMLAVVGLAGLALVSLEVRRSGSARQSIQARPPEPPAVAWWWGVVFLLLIGFVEAVAPETHHDALTAHLPIAREFVLHHAIVDMRQNTASYFPLNGDLLYAVGMAFIPGEAVPKLLHYAAGVLAAFLTYDLGTRLWDSRVGLLGAVVVAGTPLIRAVEGTAYTDLWTVLFIVGALIVLVAFTRRPTPGRAAVIGLLAGAATGAKLTSMIAAVPIAAAVVILGGSAPGWRGRWGALGAFLVGGALTGAFWYARAWVLTGNPMFPLLNALFKSPYWRPENSRFDQDLFGMGTSLRDLLLLPWRVTRYPERFVKGGDIGYAYLMLLPFALLAILRGQAPRWLWGTLAVAGLLWFFGAQYLRYLLPVLPVAAVIGGAGLLSRRLPRGVVVPVGIFLAFSVAVPTATWVSSDLFRSSLAVATGTLSRQDYAEMYVFGFNAAEYVRRALPASARLYASGEPMAFYYDRYFVTGSWLGEVFSPALRRVVLQARTGREVQSALRQAGFTHFLLNRASPLVVRRRGGEAWVTQEGFWEQPLWLEFAYREYYLFSLDSREPPRLRMRGPDLLSNGEMARGSGPGPRDWEGHGTISLAGGVGGDGQGSTRVRMAAGDDLIQRVAVVPDRLYALEARIWSPQAGSTVRLFIQWLDQEGRPLDYSTWREVIAEAEPKRYAMACTAPQRARSALIWLTATSGGQSELGNAHFYELR